MTKKDWSFLERLNSSASRCVFYPKWQALMEQGVQIEAKTRIYLDLGFLL